MQVKARLSDSENRRKDRATAAASVCVGTRIVEALSVAALLEARALLAETEPNSAFDDAIPCGRSIDADGTAGSFMAHAADLRWNVIKDFSFDAETALAEALRSFVEGGC